MSTPKYSINSEPISSILAWINSGEIAIPEIQRPFVWSATQVRDLLDSLLHGFPVGYLIIWQNPTIQLRNGTSSAGKKILIDGQQRITSLMTALMNREIITKDYSKTRIKIAFHPQEMKFEVPNSVIMKDSMWIQDVATIFADHFSTYEFINHYCMKHPTVNPNELDQNLKRLLTIRYNPLGIVTLNSELDIETVTEIFVRVNSKGIGLGQADFAMSKIAVNEAYNGHHLRKAIDYFCHIAKNPSAYQLTVSRDKDFAQSPYLKQMEWLKDENDDLYDPSYDDMLRVAFTSEFHRGRLKDLVALLSGRNFETRQYEQAIIEDTFSRLHDGIMNFMNKNNFKTFIMKIIYSTGFIDSSLITSQMALNFAYILYLSLRKQNTPHADIERHVRKWYVMSVLTGRYSGTIETTIERDINQINMLGIKSYSDMVITQELSDVFWTVALPQLLTTSSINSPYFATYRAAQVYFNDKGFLSRNISVRDLISYKSDVHHIFPKDILKKAGMGKNLYNQVANYVITQSEINIAIGNKKPKVYFNEIWEQVRGGKQRYGNITTEAELRENFAMNSIPDGIENIEIDDYDTFLDKRRVLMAQKIRHYFESLG